MTARRSPQSPTRSRSGSHGLQNEMSDRPLDDCDWLAFDVETTGCDAVAGRIVEIGAMRFRLDGTPVARFSTLINPLCSIPARVTAIHGITNAMVRHAPIAADALREFFAFLGTAPGTLLMAHNAPFDRGFVTAEAERCQIALPELPTIDTVRLSRARLPGLPSHSLAALGRAFRFVSETQHRGLADAELLAAIFRTLVLLPPAPRTMNDLCQFVTPTLLRATSRTTRTRTTPPRGAAIPSSVSTAGGERSGTGTTAAFFQAVLLAIDRRLTLRLIYQGGSTGGNWRHVTPLSLIGESQPRCLLAFCHIDRKEKQFRIDRISAWSLP